MAVSTRFIFDPDYDTMTKLTYTSFAALEADLKAGAKFVVVDNSVPAGSKSRRRDVTRIAASTGDRALIFVAPGGHFSEFKPDGTNRAGGYQLLRVADAVAEIYPLPFKTHQEVQEAFDAGTRFVIKDGAHEFAVTRIVAGSGRTTVVHSAGAGHYGCFTPSGVNLACTAKLVVRGEIKRSVKPAAQTPAPEAPAKTFLEQFIDGSEFHTPHTRETVVDVKFVRGHNRMDVTLRDETGKERVTPRYNRDGTHKFRPERNLVAGKLPPKMVERQVTIYRHAYNGTLFVIREGEVIPSIRGISNATKVGETTITEQQ